MKAVCKTPFFDGRQLFEQGKEYEVPKGSERFFSLPEQKPLIEEPKKPGPKPKAEE